MRKAECAIPAGRTSKLKVGRKQEVQAERCAWAGRPGHLGTCPSQAEHQTETVGVVVWHGADHSRPVLVSSLHIFRILKQHSQCPVPRLHALQEPQTSEHHVSLGQLRGNPSLMRPLWVLDTRYVLSRMALGNRVEGTLPTEESP